MESVRISDLFFCSVSRSIEMVLSYDFMPHYPRPIETSIVAHDLGRIQLTGTLFRLIGFSLCVTVIESDNAEFQCRSPMIPVVDELY